MTKQEKKLEQLKFLEGNLQNFMMQKNNLQTQLLEVDSALKEVGSSKNSFKIIGNLILESSPAVLKKELVIKKNQLETTIQKFEEQESVLRKKTQDIQEDLSKTMRT